MHRESIQVMECERAGATEQKQIIAKKKQKQNKTASHKRLSSNIALAARIAVP